MNQNKRYTKPYTEQGITLVALVVTIVILLILAGITIASLTGENGLIGKSGEAKNATEKSQEKEELEVAVLRFTDKRGNLDATKIVNGLQKDIKNLKEVSNTDGKFPVKVEYKNGHKYGITREGEIRENLIGAGDKAPEDSSAIYISDNNIAVIPAGFTVSGIEGETSIDNGLVVRDKEQNEWVWIPVSSADLALMYTSDTTGWEMFGTSGNNVVVTKYKTQSRLDIRNNLIRANPGQSKIDNSSVNREPDTVVGDNGTSYDAQADNRKVAGFVKEDGATVCSLDEMAVALKEDYKSMIESIKRYEGFYIGRYELSNAGIKKNQLPKTQTTWYNLYATCKKFGDGSTESRMIWGCQWDQVCNFLNTRGEKKDLNNSCSYGNYQNSTGNAAVKEGEDNKYGRKQLTGYSDYWRANNIYDIAGNCWEWTQEARGTYVREFRGGDSSNNGNSCSVNCRAGYYYPGSSSSNNMSSRPVLYIK